MVLAVMHTVDWTQQKLGQDHQGHEHISPHIKNWILESGKGELILSTTACVERALKP